MKKKEVKKGAEIVVGDYLIAIENGKRSYKWRRDGSELKIIDWDLGDFINYCLYPIQDFAKMLAESGDEPPPEAIIVERLYDGAMAKLDQMVEVIEERNGRSKIITTTFAGHDFLRQDIIDVTSEKIAIERRR